MSPVEGLDDPDYDQGGNKKPRGRPKRKAASTLKVEEREEEDEEEEGMGAPSSESSDESFSDVSDSSRIVQHNRTMFTCQVSQLRPLSCKLIRVRACKGPEIWQCHLAACA